MREETKKAVNLADKLIETGEELKRQAYLGEGPGNAITLLDEIDLEEDFSWKVVQVDSDFCKLTAKPRSARGQELFDSLHDLNSYIFAKHHGVKVFFSPDMAAVSHKLAAVCAKLNLTVDTLDFNGPEPILKLCSFKTAEFIELGRLRNSSLV